LSKTDGIIMNYFCTEQGLVETLERHSYLERERSEGQTASEGRGVSGACN
jgi:hypothetical protein